MSNRRKSPTANQNWNKTENINAQKQEAKEKSAENKERTKGLKQVTIKHPTIRKTWIIKYI